MKTRFIALLYAFSLCVCCLAQSEKPRVLISSDIGGTDPDDNQSMLHLFMYSDLFDIEGLVSSPSFGDGSKEEILRMIDIYEKDFPVLQKHCPQLKTPEELRPLCKQGRHGLAPFAGFDKPTEGSEWIIKCARRQDMRPLYVLVWGTLEDVAQALHDAPDIASRIRVYYIGGPNKKWGVNSYAYIAENFPNLWMIENNASYRGLISDSKDASRYHAGHYDACMKGAGNIGADFINYYKGVVKMGDTSSLLYLMNCETVATRRGERSGNGNPNEPEGESWGGSFEKISRSPRRIINPTTESSGTVPVYSVVEFRFKGKKQKLPIGTPCFNLLIDKQNWQGCYLGKGEYCVRYSPKQTATLNYEITSNNGAFQPIKGTLIVDNNWPGEASKTDYKLGSTWWTDRSDPSLFEGKWQGAATVRKYRQEVLDDWAERLNWLRMEPRTKNLGISGPNHTAIGGYSPNFIKYNLAPNPNRGSAVRNKLIPDIKPLFDAQIRDTQICVGHDGRYYLTGSTGGDIWKFNDGVELWVSDDLKQWDYLGLVFDIERDGTWEKEWKFHHQPVRALWAPEIHYVKGNYFITLSMPPGGRGLLKSSTGRPEGPYVNALGGSIFWPNDIDGSLFEDEDGTVYYIFGGGNIAKMKDDMSGLAEEAIMPLLLEPDTLPSHHAKSCPKRCGATDIGHEGACLFKRNGLYYLTAADHYEGRYSSMVAISDNIRGPYRLRHEAVPCGGGTSYFQDRSGQWWCSFFGNDSQAPFREMPAIVPVGFCNDGTIYVKKE